MSEGSTRIYVAVSKVTGRAVRIRARDREEATKKGRRLFAKEGGAYVFWIGEESPGG